MRSFFIFINIYVTYLKIVYVKNQTDRIFITDPSKVLKSVFVQSPSKFFSQEEKEIDYSKVSSFR